MTKECARCAIRLQALLLGLAKSIRIMGSSILCTVGTCMCGPQGYGFSAILVINRVLIFADFSHFGHK